MGEIPNGEELKEKLFNIKKNGWEETTAQERERIFKFSEEYIYFLNNAKTEREAVIEAKDMLDKNGFKDISDYKELKTGDRVYYINRNKCIYAAVIGEEKMENGINIIGSHIDSPRLDLKPNPLYEDSGFALLKTHYYGGIKKYQWTTIPLSIHGVIAKTDGEVITVNIGEDEMDPVFVITDLLPHLAQEQMEKKLKEGIGGEDLNVLIGSIPYEDKKVTERIKLNILNILNKKYEITEADFISSELEIVPAFNAKSLGFDRSMVVRIWAR